MQLVGQYPIIRLMHGIKEKKSGCVHTVTNAVCVCVYIYIFIHEGNCLLPTHITVIAALTSRTQSGINPYLPNEFV